MRRQLLPILVIGAALVLISAFRWADPYWAFCGPCWAHMVDEARAKWGPAFVGCTPLDNGHSAICNHIHNPMEPTSP